MPQLNKGGKYIFGWSTIKEDNTLTFPPELVKEYNLEDDNFIYIISGSKQTGGFSVTTDKLLSSSKLKNILEDNSELKNKTLKEGELISYKGRKYGWLRIKNNSVYIPKSLMINFEMKIGDKLLSIRSSNIAFTMGIKGALIDRANLYSGVIETY